MKKTLACLLAALAGCASPPPPEPASESSSPPAPAVPSATAAPAAVTASAARSLDSYKVDLANRISQSNAAKVYEGRPQALLRSVIVVRYTIDRNGNLTHSEILRSNRDRITESIALASLRSAAPFPRPGSHLLKNGRVEVSESWLFNSDGRFQLRSIAQAQMTE